MLYLCYWYNKLTYGLDPAFISLYVTCVIPIWILDGRPSLRPGTPGGSEEPHPQAGTRAYSEVRRGERRSTPASGYPEGVHLKANRYNVEESMCQTTAYVIEDDREVLLLQDVISIKPENGALRMVNLFGEEKIVPGRIKQIDLLAHKILIVN